MNVFQSDGTFWRVADPDWDDPFDGTYSMRQGQRWNARGSFPVTYLNANTATARANAQHMIDEMASIGIDVDDLEEGQLPVIVPCALPERTVLDGLSNEGCIDVGLPVSYPFENDGRPIKHERCQPIGRRAYEDDLDGIEYRSAALLDESGRELAWFDRPGRRLSRSGSPIPHYFGGSL